MKNKLKRKIERLKIIIRDNWICKYCGKCLKDSLEELTLDHVIPRCRGGHSTKENLVVACKFCNSKKGSMGEGQILSKKKQMMIEQRKKKEEKRGCECFS